MKLESDLFLDRLPYLTFIKITWVAGDRSIKQLTFNPFHVVGKEMVVDHLAEVDVVFRLLV